LLKLNNKQEFRKIHQLSHQRIVLFHPGYGGSSDGNLELEDYVKLAVTVRQLENIQVIWVFGPDDLDTENKIKKLIPDSDIIHHPETVLDYCYLIKDSELLISTSTGPMHLAGALNIKTVSFFGDSLFAGPKRWSTISEISKQSNFVINKDFKLLSVERVIIEKLC